MALRSFVETAEDTALIGPLLPTLLNECFKLMAEVDNETSRRPTASVSCSHLVSILRPATPPRSWL